MGYIVQSIVFDKDKGWDMKSAREWVKNHKEFSKPIKEEETINTIRVRLFPPKKAEQMGFTDYRMKTLASGDVGIMLDIAYNKLKGSGTSSSKVAVTDEDEETESDRMRNDAFEENGKLYAELIKLGEELNNINNQLKSGRNLKKKVLLKAEITARMEKIENKMAENQKILIGGSLANEDLQALLAKSYHSKHPSDYKDFQVDKELSGQRVQVYHNPTTQQTIVAHRGTSSVPNWIENVAYAVSNDKSGKAFQHSKKIQDQAYSKYGKENITTIGHSKGALHAQEYGKEGKEVITLNKPVNITDALFTRVPKSQTDIRTQYDPVSFLRPFQRGNKAETIKSTTKNPLAEHKTSVLGRLDPRRLFGSGEEGGKRDTNQRESEDNPGMVSNQQLQQEQLQLQLLLQQNRQSVNAILGQEINNITQLFRRQREDRLSLKEGLVPEFLLDDQIGYANASNLAQRLREAILEQVTADTDVSNPQQIASHYRRVFTENLRTILRDNNAQRRAGEPISEGSGMAMCSRCGVNCSCGMMRGGMVEEEEEEEEEEEDVGINDNIKEEEKDVGIIANIKKEYNEKIQKLNNRLRSISNRGYMTQGTNQGNAILQKIRFLEEEKDKLIEDIKSQNLMERLRNREIKMGRGMSGGMVEDENFGVFIDPQQFIERRRQLSNELRELNEMWEGTDEGLEKAQKKIEDKIELLTRQMEEQKELARVGLMNYLKNREIKRGRGMSGGVSIQFSNGLFEFNTTSPYSFYRSIRAYYFLQRPQRKEEYRQVLTEVPNFVRQQEQSIVRDFQNNWNEFLDVLNGDNMQEKRRIVGATEIDIGSIIDAGIDGSVYTESEGELSSSDEEEGAGMHGGAGVGIFNDEELGEYEDVFNTTTSVMGIYTKLMKFINKHGGNKDVVRQRLLSSYIQYVPNSTRAQRNEFLNKFDRYANLGEDEGAGMCGGKFGDATDPLTFALYLVGALIGVPLTRTTFNYLYNIYQSNRQIIDDAMTDTTGSGSDVDSVVGEEGAGMSGGVIPLPPFDVNIGRLFREAKRRWAKSPKMFENLAYERRLFDDKYEKLMRHLRLVTGTGGMDLMLYSELMNYSKWVKGLDIPEISRGAGKKAKKAKKGKN